MTHLRLSAASAGLLLMVACAARPTPVMTHATPPPARAVAAGHYFPSPGRWETCSPADAGFDEALLAQAVAYAQSRETDWDFAKQTEVFGSLLGPLPATRARTNGVIIRHGYIVAQFGDVHAPDPTYSVAKSYLATLLGLTLDRGLIPDIDRPVGELVRDEIGGGYKSAHNAGITWRHHVTQTSEWQGELFGKPSTFIGREKFGKAEMPPRELKPPGTFYEYNDVRMNRFALSLLHVWKEPLPEVLRREVMKPIGASASWRWIPYDNATVSINGTSMPSISGGTRWGGGLWISTLDHARVGLLMLRKGEWDGRRILSERWIADATSPQGVRGDYGYLWWLNTQDRWPRAPKSSYSAQGAGDNTIWIDPEHDLVVVWRWHRGADTQAQFYAKILDALRKP